MKFLHIADLHIGKRVNEFSMLSDQKYILEQILAYAEEERPDACLLCGDIYDKPLPPAEAVQLFDSFLTRLCAICGAVLIIPGNHDSAERLSFGADMLRHEGVYLARPFGGEIEKVRLLDEFGPVDFWLLPFVKPVQVRRLYEDAEDIVTYDEAMARIMRDFVCNGAKRNVLLAHQLLTGAKTCESEELAVGGLDNVSVAHFAPFDYVALGHLHGAQRVGRDEVRYAGSPLKYSFSEVNQQKSVSMVEMAADGAVSIRLLPLEALHEMREVKGKFAELIEAAPSEDYLHVTLTDDEDVIDAQARLRQLYPNLMRLDYDNRRTQGLQVAQNKAVLGKSPLALFEEFYQRQNNQELSSEQTELLRSLIEEIWEETEDIREEKPNDEALGGAK